MDEKGFFTCIKHRDRKPYDPGKYPGKIKQVEKSGFGETLTLHSE